MAQTDRQTDKPATHWKTAIFDTGDNWAILTAPPPSFIKKVIYKKEVCPTTGKEHYQTHVICNAQQRLTRLCKWISQTKWFAVFGEDHIRNSINYISKTETTAPGALVHEVEGDKYLQFHEILLEVAKQLTIYDAAVENGKEFLSRRDWPLLSSRLVRQDLKWANKLSNPALHKCWTLWGEVFLDKVSEYLSETCGAFIIEAPPEDTSVSEDGTDRSEADVCLID